MYVPRATYSLRMSFCTVPASADSGDTLSLGDGDVQRQQDDRRRVDRHRRRDAVERNPVEERRHVVDRIDRDADAPDFAGGERVIRVVADLRRQIEGDAQPVDALAPGGSGSARSTASAVAKPAYCRIVHSRPRYMVGWMPRVKGNSPGTPRSDFWRPARQIVGCARVMHRADCTRLREKCGRKCLTE